MTEQITAQPRQASQSQSPIRVWLTSDVLSASRRVHAQVPVTQAASAGWIAYPHTHVHTPTPGTLTADQRAA